MAKTLENLIRLHKYRVDEKRRILGVLYAQQQDLIQKMNDLERQVEQEMNVAKTSPDKAMFSYGRFHQRAMAIREEIVRAIIQKEGEVQLARNQVNEAFRELKVYEEAEKNRKEREKEERNRKENIEMDEIAMNLYRQKKDFDE